MAITTHIDNGGSGAGVLGHLPARKTRRRVLKTPGPRTPRCPCVLNTLELCLSHKSTVRYNALMVEKFDADVKKWIESPQDKHLVRIVGDNIETSIKKRDQRKDNPNTDFHW